MGKASSHSAGQKKKRKEKKSNLTPPNEGKDTIAGIGFPFFNWTKVSRYREGGRY